MSRQMTAVTGSVNDSLIVSITSRNELFEESTRQHTKGI
jgi:hypothetical protein